MEIRENFPSAARMYYMGGVLVRTISRQVTRDFISLTTQRLVIYYV